MFCAGGAVGVALIVVMVEGDITGGRGVFFVIVSQRQMVGHFRVIVIGGLQA